jgi:hypothetical protein
MMLYASGQHRIDVEQQGSKKATQRETPKTASWLLQPST